MVRCQSKNWTQLVPSRTLNARCLSWLIPRKWQMVRSWKQKAIHDSFLNRMMYFYWDFIELSMSYMVFHSLTRAIFSFWNVNRKRIANMKSMCYSFEMTQLSSVGFLEKKKKTPIQTLRFLQNRIVFYTSPLKWSRALGRGRIQWDVLRERNGKLGPETDEKGKGWIKVEKMRGLRDGSWNEVLWSTDSTECHNKEVRLR